MKTIGERAAHIAQEFGATKSNKERAIYRACIRMATEQKAIDIENAREWIINTYLGDYVTDEFGNGGIGDNVKLAEDFCKAMED